MLYEFDQREVRRALFESRGRADDARDLEVLRKMRDRQRLISPALKVDHVPGRADAGLWVADALCGVVSASRTGESGYLDVLAGRITLVAIDHTGHVSP